MNGTAKNAEKYTKSFVRAILRGLRNQFVVDGTIFEQNWNEYDEMHSDDESLEDNFPELEVIPEDDIIPMLMTSRRLALMVLWERKGVANT